MPTPVSVLPISIIQQAASQNSPKANNKTKLSKLTLPKFAGDPRKWKTWWDSFYSAIHSNEELNGVDKFQYLKSLLEGCTAETISGLPLTISNYKRAVDLLTKPFGSKQQVIISKHIEMLMQLPKIRDSSDLKQLRQLLDNTGSTVRCGWQGIHILIDTYGTFLTPVIMATGIAQELHRNCTGIAFDFKSQHVLWMGPRNLDKVVIRRTANSGETFSGTSGWKGKWKQEVGSFRYGQNKRPSAGLPRCFHTSMRDCR